ALPCRLCLPNDRTRAKADARGRASLAVRFQAEPGNEEPRSRKDTAMTAKSYDPTTKVLVEIDPESWPAFVGSRCGPTTVIDADIATVSGAADKVLRVGVDAPYLLHLEFATGHDGAELPRDMHVRNALLDKRHNLPVRSVAILLR